MRGRTNITPRTGPTVIGNLVTHKQVAGSPIEMGDFVEFTGDTSTWESLLGPFNYRYSYFFSVTDTVKGVFYINASSSQCKCVIFNNVSVLKETSLVSITFDDDIITNISYDSVNRKIYVIQDDVDKIYVFNLAQNYSISYDRTITVTASVSGAGSANRQTICVKNNMIYCLFRGGVAPMYMLEVNLDGNTIINEYSSSIYQYGDFFVTENYIFIFGFNDTEYKLVFNFNTKDFVSTKGSADNNYLRYLSSNYKAKLIEKDGYFFFVGWDESSANSPTSRITIFYLNPDYTISIVISQTLLILTGGNSLDRNYWEILVEKNGNNFTIILWTWNYNSNRRRYDYFLLNFNSSSGVLEFLQNDFSYIPNESSVVRGAERLLLVNYDDVYNLFFTNGVVSTSTNRLCKTKFVINNHAIVQTESLDLVKKYENHIDGVAKIGGDIGQQISVYIP